jgi:uncharacterized membrane protein
MNRQQIKMLSKKQLGGGVFSNNWLMGVVIVLIVSALSSICAMIPCVGTVAAIVISGPLQYGICYIFVKLARTVQPIDISDIFEGFKSDFVNVFLIGLMQGIFIMLWSLLLVIPGIIKAYAYSMAFYIKADHPEYDWNMCIKESMKIMEGHKWDLFVQDLSFIGWMILGMCLCGIGTLWVQPYMQMARANFYENIKTNEQNM